MIKRLICPGRKLWNLWEQEGKGYRFFYRFPSQTFL